jgi:hypothetical protein
VQYHAGLQALLFNAVRRVARRPAFVPPLTHAEERALEAYDAGVDEWHSRCVRAHAAVIGSAQSEATACQEGFAHLAEPINDFVADSANFERGKHPMFTTGWVWPTPKDASGLTDWVAYSSDTPQAILKWKQGVTDANMRDVVQAAVGRVHSWPLALYPGFSIWLDDDGNRVVTDSGVAGNGVAACLLVGFFVRLVLTPRDGPTRTTTARAGL